MSWSGDFKRLRMKELNSMKLKDRGDHTMIAEYTAICNGVANPSATHNFNKPEAKNWHIRDYGKANNFMLTEMADLPKKKMVAFGYYYKPHKAFDHFPSNPNECSNSLQLIHGNQTKLNNSNNVSKEQQSVTSTSVNHGVNQGIFSRMFSRFQSEF